MNSAIVVRTLKIIEEALTYRYGRHLPHYLNCKSRILSDRSISIALTSGILKFTIDVAANVSGYIYDYQLPKTRITYTIIQTSHSNIHILRYYDVTVVLIHNDTSSDGNGHNLIMHTQDHFISDNKYVQEGKHSYRFSFTETGIILLDQNNNIEFGKLPQTINNWIEKERKNHPLNHIYISDYRKMAEIDHLWSQVSSVDADFDISSLNSTESIQNFMWIQEIYFQFGWLDKLDNIYLKYNSKENTASFFPLLKLAYLRYMKVSQLLGRDYAEITFDSIASNRFEFRFISEILNGFFVDSSNQLKQIQQFWELIHLPILEHALYKICRYYPYEIIAFSMLALQNNFCWFGILKEKLLSKLTGNSLIIFRLICLLKEGCTTQFDTNNLILTRFKGSSDTSCSMRFNEKTESNYHSFSKTIFSELKIDNGIHLKINKEVNLKFNLKNNVAIIEPLLLSPPIFDHNFNQISIQVTNQKLIIPAIWDQFTVLFQEMRFKFLRKKKKLQCSLKFPTKIDSVTINQTIFQKGKHSQKILIELPVSENKFHASIQNEFGSEQEIAFTKNSGFRLRLLAIDKLSILHQQFRLKLEGSKRTYLNTEDLNRLEPIPIIHQEQKLFGFASGIDRFETIINEGDDFIKRLIYSKPEHLFQKIIFFIDESEMDDIESFKNILFNWIGLKLPIKGIESYKYAPHKVPVIIHKSLEGEKPYQYVLISKKPVQRAIIVKKQLLETIAKLLSFTDL